MTRIHLIVEGQSEESFVNNVLAPYLANESLFIDVRSVVTGRKGPKTFRGGMTSYQKAKKDILTWMAEDKKAYMSCMFDLYGLPPDFPGFSESKSKSPRDRVEFLEKKLGEDICESRFIPYIQLHEFESLLFSDPGSINDLVPGKNRLSDLNKILDGFNGDPELINDSPNTAPSKRIQALYPRYDKVAYCSRVIEKAGLEIVIKKCSHFGSWIDKLRGLF